MTVSKTALQKIGGFNTNKAYYGVEDYKLWLDLVKLGSIETIKAPLSVFSVNSSNFSGDIYRLNDNLKKLVNDEITKNYVAPSKLLRKHLSRIDYYKGRALENW